MVKLHDRLYEGPLSSHLRLDIPFIPHIAVANATDPKACKALADALNHEGFEIGGSVDHARPPARFREQPAHHADHRRGERLPPGPPVGSAGWLAFAWCAGLLAVFVPLSVSLYRRTTAR